MSRTQLSRTRRMAAIMLATFPFSLALWGCRGDTEGEPAAPETTMEEEDFRLRSDVEAALPARAEAFAADPGDDRGPARLRGHPLQAGRREGGRRGHCAAGRSIFLERGRPAARRQDGVPARRPRAGRDALRPADGSDRGGIRGPRPGAAGPDPDLVPDQPVRQGGRARVTGRGRGRVEPPRLHAGVRGRALRDRAGRCGWATSP